MTESHCKLCHVDMDSREFGEHIDGHSDYELEKWPGGFEALEMVLVEAIAESKRHQ